MAELTKPAAGDKPAAAPAAASEPQATTVTIKRKRKYSRGLRSSQDVERGLNRAASALADAGSSAFGTYKKRSRKSSYKKRDGAIRDAIKNFTKAASKGLKKATDAPYQMVKAVNRGKGSKQIRDTVKMFSPPMFR